MAETPAPRAAGALLALSIIAGALIGVLCGESTIGILAGTAIGLVIAISFWWRERPR
jgi:uncharacterized membrane protein (UPF0136 family)